MARSPILLAALLVGGCIGPGVYGSARTLAPAQSQYTFVAEATSFSRGDAGGAAPALLFAYRRGLAESLELGLATGPIPHAAVDLKWQWLSAGPVAAAVAPTIAYTWLLSSTHYFSGRVPLLLQIDLARPVALIAAGSVTVLASACSAGGSACDRGGTSFYSTAGVAVRLRIDGIVALEPSLALGNVGPPLVDQDRGPNINLGLAISFGDEAYRP